MPRTKSAEPTTAAAWRAVVREILQRDFKSQTEMAERLGISQSHISNLLSATSGKGPGPVLMDAIKRYDRDLAARAMGTDSDDAVITEIAAILEPEGTAHHIARVSARAALELGHTGDSAIAVARAFSTFATVLAAQPDARRTAAAQKQAGSSASHRRAGRAQ